MWPSCLAAAAARAEMPPPPQPVASAEEAAAAYARDGLFWTEGVLSAHELAILRTAAAEHFYEVLRALMVKQVLHADGGMPPVRYAEVNARDGARFDCRHGMEAEPLASLLRPGGVAAALLPLLRRVLGDDAEVCQVGQIVAMNEEGWATHSDDESFGDQAWHTDGRNSGNDTDALTVFIPLVDVTPDNGATEFVLGSHTGGGGGGAASDAERCKDATPLYLPAGSAVAFDYRTWHRGLRNMGLTDRPVLYAIVGRPVWRDGLKGLPQLDGGSTSLFSGELVPPPPGWSLREEANGAEAEVEPQRKLRKRPARRGDTTSPSRRTRSSRR